jgi:KDO2-lipid IV(A) lauroyltransferase
VKGAPVRHALEFALALPVLTLVALLPHGAVRRLGGALGAAAGVVDRRRRRIARENLAAALPELDRRERERVVARCFRHFGAAFLDALSTRRFDGPELCRRVTWEGLGHLVAAEAAGRGVIVLAAHFGNWEVVPAALGANWGPMAAVGRPVDNPHVDRLVQALRVRFGNRSIPKRGAVREMFRVLAAGGRLGLLIDQRVRAEEAIDVPFFGRPALTSPVVARLALRTGAPVVPVAGYHEPGGRYRVVFDPPLWPEGADDEVATFAFTRRCLEASEAAIRRHPEQWLWLHRRWKH